jgi:tetratricopeptide (TPR) repeat protein
VQIAANRDRDQSLKLLTSVAGSREAPYATRAEAAVALAPLKSGGVNSGGPELDLLAASGTPDFAAVQQPFFYHARVDIAERLKDPAAKIRLLLEALAINPEAESPRVSLFRSALRTEQYQLALSAIEPLLEPSSNPYRYRYQQRQLRMRPRVEEEEGGPEGGTGRSAQFLTRIGLDAAQRASLAGGIAEAYEKQGRLGDAEEYWEVALQLEPAEAARAELKHRLELAKLELQRQGQDRSRRPVVTENLEQGNWVRPRLASRGVGTTSSGPGGKGR